MIAKVSLAIGLIVPALLLPQALTLLKGFGELPSQPAYRAEPAMYQSRVCDPVNDPESCKSS